MKPPESLTFLFLLSIYGTNSTVHEVSRKNFFIEDVNLKTSLIDLVVDLSGKYLTKCTPVITYDRASEDPLINHLLRRFTLPQIHGNVEKKSPKNSRLLGYHDTCKVHILFVEDVMDANAILGPQNKNKIIIVTKSSQWRVHEYLSERSSQKIVDLLVISRSEMVVRDGEETPYVLYTHKLFVDAIASSKHVVLTSWRNGRFTRPGLNLFPNKMSGGFAGHRFTISLAHFPPFVIKRGVDSNDNIIWDGLEVRLVQLLAQIFNFTTDFVEAPNYDDLGSADAVMQFVGKGKANLGISGILASNEIAGTVDVSNMYHQDCAAFMTLTSTALPRYRAIMGPFHWTVWLSLTFIYLFAIIPLTFSHKHTLRPLLEHPEEIENMFWYVFGNFTNAFTFNQGESWTNSDKMATRVFIGFYWIFTIIISACYTGSIIAFVTLPVYPETMDKVSQLLQGRYQIGTLDKSGWVNRFANSSEPLVEKLMSKVDLVPTVEEGVKNTTKAFFWPYAFLGSKTNLDYIIRTEFVSTKKRAAFHISDECLATYATAFIYPKNSEYAAVLNAGLDRVVQAGFVKKLESDVEWLMMRSSSGKLLAANRGKKNPLIVEDRALTLDDTQGMFLLLGIGFIMGGASLFFEIFGGCFNLCKKKGRLGRVSSIPSNPRSFNGLTPKQRVNHRIVSTINVYSMDTSGIVNEEVLNGQSVVNREVLVDAPKDIIEGNFELAEVEKEINALFDFEQYFGEKTIADSNLEQKYLKLM